MRSNAAIIDTERVTLTTPFGPMEATASERGLLSLTFVNEGAGGGTATSAQPRPSSQAAEILRQTASELDEYFAGARREFEVPLDLRGTPFQKRVWDLLLAIEYGRTCSYVDLARFLGDEKKTRAVGGANGDNPIAIIVPCHRVIAADGTLGGYAGGLERKRWLLEHEGVLKADQNSLFIAALS